MRIELLAEQDASFQKRGWLVLPGVVPASRIPALNAEFDRLMEPLSGESNGQGVLLLPGACSEHDALLQHLYDGVAEVAGRLLRARRVRLLQEALLLKPSQSNGIIALHQDYTYTGFLDPPAMVSVGLALTDASIQHGCLCVIDGSHTWGLIGKFATSARELRSGPDNGLSPSQLRHIDRASVALEVRAGDVTIHHCLTFHGSYRNASREPRKTVVAHVFDGDCTVVTSRLPPHAANQFVTDDRGRPGPAFPTLYET